MSARLIRIFMLLPVFGLIACENKSETHACRVIANLSVEKVGVLGSKADLDENRLVSVDTFTDQLSSLSIAHLYYAACDKMTDLYGDVVVCRYSDQMGYPGQVTIVQLDDETLGPFYLEAGVFEANDNDSFWLLVKRGSFDLSDDERREKKEKIPNWTLDGILRCNHE